MWQLDHKAGWAPKKWCFQTAVLEKTPGSPLDCKEIQPVNSKGNQPWIVTGRTDTEAEAPTLWPPDAKSWLFRKDLDVGKDWGQERGWQRTRWLGSITDSMDMNLSKPGESGGQRNLGCYSPCGLQRVGHNLVAEQQTPNRMLVNKNSGWGVFTAQVSAPRRGPCRVYISLYFLYPSLCWQI